MPSTSIAQKVLAEATGNYEARKHPVMLSYLGSVVPEIAEAHVRLGQFIREHIPELKLVWRSNRKEMAAIPADAPLPSDWSAVPEEHEFVKDNAYYFPAVWAAFSKPLEGSLRRYLSTTPPQHFHDVAANSEPPEQTIEVEAHHIITDTTLPLARRRNAINASIHRWIEENALIASDFQPKSTPSPTAAKAATSHLYQHLGKLSAQDRARILIPADIVEKLIQAART